MPHVDAYLFFDGTCAEAMRFYERALGGRIETMMTNAEAPHPEPLPPGSADRILHASLAFDGGGRLMASDWMSGEPYEGIKGVSLSLGYPTAGEARRVFDALADGGVVRMPLQKTFWAEAFGMLVDRYGTPWMVGTESSAG